tara:strand:+ start:2014 stop:2229 length:216 start_codon:yes stop_codon:yes gene_type:complete
MTKQELVSMAREAGLADANGVVHAAYQLEAFAALVAAAEPTCPECKAKVLYECVACSSNNYPPQQRKKQND